jgi:REP element-mobilizing transposase RayT
MARPLRVWEENCLYHLIFKGNFGQPIVSDTKERQELQKRLDAVAAKYDLIVLAFCAMDTHVHLLIRVGTGDVSKAMQELIGGYSRWRNHRHRVRGNLFRSRFWSKQVRNDGQLLVTARYIELNPVAAGMRSSPEDWEWSSCRAHLGRAHPPRFLARAEFLRLFAPDPRRARVRYERFLREGVRAARAKNRERRLAAMLLPDVPAWVDIPTEA